MKQYLLTMFVLLCCVSFVGAQEAQTLQVLHQAVLAKERITVGSSDVWIALERDGSLFSVAAGEQTVSLLTSQEDKVYHLYFVRDGNAIAFSIRAIRGKQTTLSGIMEKSGMQLTIKVDEEKSTPGIDLDSALPLLLSVMQPACECSWWQGLTSFSASEYESRSYYATRDEAVANVPTHVSPKYCFVWKDGGGSLPWRPIPGTGCAHWVAHQKGIHSSPGCYDGYGIRVSQVTAGRTSHSLSNANVGDIWTNTDSSHCGIVISVGSGQVKVRHCSSGSGGVVESWFSSGYAWR
jgi:hypothetical protein